MSIVPPTYGRHHAVSAGHELAALAAHEVLEHGGNAIDAAVAGSLTLGVVYSDQVSIAGVAPMMIYLAQTDRVVTIAGVGGWPAALDVDDYIRRYNGEIPVGVLRTVVPAAPDAYLQALEQFGTMRFADVAQRAVQYATRGFAVHDVMRDYIASYEQSYRQFADNVEIWMPDDRVPVCGELLVQQDLGATLQYLCDQERSAGGSRVDGLAAVRDAFYRGDIAAQILAHQRANGGLLAAADLGTFRSQILPSVARNFRLGPEEVQVHACGAWSQGPAMLEALSILQQSDIADSEPGSADYLHRMAEVLKLALADREAYIGDPDFVSVPVETMISDAYGAQRAVAIDPQRASPGMPMPGRIDGIAPWLSPAINRSEPERLPADTSIVSVIDAQGNAVCVTPSDTSWDTPVVPGTGLAVSSRGDQSWAVPGHPSCIAPGKRPRLTPNPCFARVKGRWIMPFGTPGGDTQVQANVQVLMQLARGLDLQEAIEAPRLMTHSHPDSFAPHHVQPGRLTLEGRIADSVCETLSGRGHQVEKLADWTHRMAGVCAVRKDLDSGLLQAAADPRRFSRAMGW